MFTVVALRPREESLAQPSVLSGDRISEPPPWVYRATALMPVAVALLTSATGARTSVMWFKITPILLTTTAGAVAGREVALIFCAAGVANRQGIEVAISGPTALARRS